MCDKCLVPIYKAVDAEFGDDKLKQYFDKLTKKLSKVYLSKLEEYLINAEQVPLAKTAIDDLWEWIKKLLGSVYGYWQKVITDQVKQETKDLIPLLDLDSSISFAISTDPAANYAEQRAGELIKWINDGVKKEMERLVSDAIKQGRTQTKLKEEIMTKFDQFTTTRSALIARQEVALAHWGGRYTEFTKQARNFGSTWFKRAVTQRDDKVRPGHQENADAWRIPADQSFPGTGWLYEPFSFNCRCKVNYLVYKPD